MALRGEDLRRPTYRFLQTISEGNTSQCWLSYHTVFRKPVVQKTVSLLGVPDAIANGEPQLLERLRHERIVRVREAQWEPKSDPTLKLVTFTMDYLEGKSIAAALLEGHVFDAATALQITADTLLALAFLHDQEHVLHRDVKPGNILLDGDRAHGHLGDLGSAATMRPDGTVDANSGTPFYWPPEYHSGVLSGKSDIYGVGMNLVEMLRGGFPFAEFDDADIDRRNGSGRRSLADRWFTLPAWVGPEVQRFARSLVHVDPLARPDAATALSRLRRLRYVNWAQEPGSPLTWTAMHGVYERRAYRVSIDAPLRGRHAGQWHVQADRALPGGTARRYTNLDQWVEAGNYRALANVFRAVEADAHRFAAR